MEQTVQKLRNDLASCISDLKRDHQVMSDTDVAHDIGYIRGLSNAIKTAFDPEYYKYDYPECRQINRLVERIENMCWESGYRF